MLQDTQLWDGLECVHSPVSGDPWQFRNGARKALPAILLGGSQVIYKSQGGLMPLSWGSFDRS